MPVLVEPTLEGADERLVHGCLSPAVKAALVRRPMLFLRIASLVSRMSSEQAERFVRALEAV